MPNGAGAAVRPSLWAMGSVAAGEEAWPDRDVDVSPELLRRRGGAVVGGLQAGPPEAGLRYCTIRLAGPTLPEPIR